MTKAGLAVGISLFAAGCFYVQSGHRFDPHAVDEMRPGITTKQEAIARLGEPSALSAMANDAELLQWQYVYGTPVGGGGEHVAILFDANSRMVRVTHRSRQ